MSQHRSLKSASSLVRHRNVLTRAERLEMLQSQDKWSDSKSVYGLPKVAHRKMELAKPVKEEVAADGAVPGAAAPAAGAAKGAKGAKGAAPAAGGAKGAAAGKGAPAAKGAAGAKGAGGAKGAAPAAAAKGAGAAKKK